MITNIKDSGNYFYKNNNYVDSDRKYKKALRYIDWMNTKTVFYKNNKRFLDMQVQILLNLAAVNLYKKQNKDVLNLCNNVCILI